MGQLQHLQPRRASSWRPGPTVLEALLGALALMLVLEGLMPFISPSAWRKMFERATQMSDGQIRFMGLCSIAGGLVLLMVWRATH